MIALDLMTEAAALAGYTIDSSTQGTTNKARALRRLNMIKADVISRYGGKWPANYREGWLALYPLAPCMATFTPNSYTVPVTSDNSPLGNQIFGGNPGTVPSYMAGAKILAPDAAYYRIAAVDSTNVYLDTPYQGPTPTQSPTSTVIWNDEYYLYPDAHAVAGFVNYQLIETMKESWPANFKDSFPKQVSVGDADRYEVIGKSHITGTYSTGSVSGNQNSNILTGTGTAWKSSIQPGWKLNIGGVYYHVEKVVSDTSLQLYQLLTTSFANSLYTSVGENAIRVRFRYPTNQIVVHYWYWAKDRPAVNDSDEDWIMELYPRVIVNGISYFDYIDKNDVARAFNSNQVYEDSVKSMRVAQDTAYTGVRTIALYVPPSARE